MKMFRTKVHLAAMSLACLLGSAATGIAADQAAEKAAISEAVASYAEAFNSGNAVALAAHWSPDAVYVNPMTGTEAEGRVAIAKEFNVSFEDAEKRKIAITTAKAAREAEALAEKEQEQQQAIARQAAKLQRRKARDDAKRAQQRTLVL